VVTSRVLAHSKPTRLGVADAPLSFTRPVPGHLVNDGPGSRRLRLDGADAFDLAFWCGTCPLVFERLYGSNRTLSIDELQERLNTGLTSMDRKVQSLASKVIPTATYLPLLFSISPTLVMPADGNDYFSHEQVAHRGVDQFWGLPESPRTPYYRVGNRKVGEHEFLFEFVVPMVPPSWNEASRVQDYETELREGKAPTVLAIAVLDRTQPFNSHDAHVGLVHFILDGHHKMEAAARAGMPITMLSFVSVDDSLSNPKDVTDLPRWLSSTLSSEW
jgi:hypothetical protein